MLHFFFSPWFLDPSLPGAKELRWRSRKVSAAPDILDLVRCIVEDVSDGCETLAAVYLEHLIASFRQQQQVAQFSSGVRGVVGMPRSENVVEAALGIVALHALGAENCLLLADSDVIFDPLSIGIFSIHQAFWGTPNLGNHHFLGCF